MNDKQKDLAKLCTITLIIPMLLVSWVVITYTSFEMFGWAVLGTVITLLLPTSLQFMVMMLSIFM